MSENKLSEKVSDKVSDGKEWLVGWWAQYHKDSFEADKDPEMRKNMVKRLHFHANTFPCETCRPHFKSFVTHNPPEEAPSLSVYIWNFHNQVNVRLGKPIMEYDTCVKVWGTGGTGPACSSCNNASVNTNVQQEKLSNEFLFG